MVMPMHTHWERNAHTQGRLTRSGSPCLLAKRRAEAREAGAMTNMIEDILMGWLFLAALALAAVAHG